jgi:hypothetical protein
MRRRSLPPAIAPLALAACLGHAPPAPLAYAPLAPLPGAAAVSFTLPRGPAPPAFFDLPWPTELLRRADGRPDLRAFPGRDAPIFGAYVEAAEQDIEGYGLSPAIYFHFTAPITPRLPFDPRVTASLASPVFLLDVDPASPERGAFVPLEHRAYARDQRYLPGRTLVIKPAAGALLRPSTLYAAVVRRDLGGPDAELGTTLDLEIVKWTRPRADPREERARLLHQGALDFVASLGLARDRVAGIALFRTHAPHLVTARLVDAIEQLPPRESPRVLDAAWNDDLAAEGYLAVEGTYCTPNFQTAIERAPFIAEPGGRFALDAEGRPRPVPVPAASPYRSDACGGLLRARFVLTIPKRRPPRDGFPLLVVAHGTGGDARSFVGSDDFAGWAAMQGIAVIGTDQPLHGGRGPAPRPGSREPVTVSIAGVPVRLSRDPASAEVAFYNPVHPAAARDNLRQATADLMVLARLFTAVDLAPLLPLHRPAPRFDRRKVLAAGHSQGSQSVAVLGAVDPLVRGVILSGCGGDARLGILRRKDLPVVPAFAALAGLEPGELDELHPFMTLLQTLADPIDPATYARFYWEPPPGRRAPSVLHVEGLGDSFTPPVTAEALALALRATPIARSPAPVAGLPAPAALADLARRGALRAFLLLAPTRAENGHFVLYYEPLGAEAAMEFMRLALAL